jgi:SAM-dependent methyltransferase
MISIGSSFKSLGKRINDYSLIKKRFSKVSELLSDNGRFTCYWKDRILVFGEDTKSTKFDAHYLYHTAWAARILQKNKPDLHIDISSDLRFVTLVSAFIPIDFYDYRPVNIPLSGLNSKHGDLMDLPFPDNSVSSISCMHVIEHIGLQRYGDPLDAKGDIRAINELIRVLKPGGQLFFVVPVGGTAQIRYNAHRIYTVDMVQSLFSSLIIKEFALITDNNEYIEHATTEQVSTQSYGCGCWLLTK